MLQDRSVGRITLGRLLQLGDRTFKLAQPLFADPYADNRATGAFILMDESTNNTVGAGMIG